MIFESGFLKKMGCSIAALCLMWGMTSCGDSKGSKNPDRKLKEENQKLEDEVSHLENKTRQLAIKNAQQTKEARSLQRQIASLNAEIKQNSRGSDVATEMVQKLIQERNQLVQRSDAANKSLKDLQVQLTDYKSRLAKVNAETKKDNLAAEIKDKLAGKWKSNCIQEAGVLPYTVVMDFKPDRMSWNYVYYQDNPISICDESEKVNEGPVHAGKLDASIVDPSNTNKFALKFEGDTGIGGTSSMDGIISFIDNNNFTYDGFTSVGELKFEKTNGGGFLNRLLL